MPIVRPTRLEIGPAGQAAARAIERLRAARSYSQRQLAARVTALGRPMTFTQLSRIERQVRRCDIDDSRSNPALSPLTAATQRESGAFLDA